MAHYDSEKNRFNPDNRFIGDIEDGKRYPFACYTKEESDAKYAPISTSTDLTALTAVVATKAAQSDLTALSGVVDTKAAQSDLTTLSETVSGKASQADLTTLEGTVSDLTTTVSGKASQSDLNALSATVATKAAQSDLTALSSVVAAKANASDVTSLSATVALKANQSALDSTNAVVATKATQTSVDSITSTLNTKADKTAVDNLSTLVDGKASQASVDALETTIASKANSSDLIATNLSLAHKADTTSLETAAANLQSQIDNLVTPVTQDAEVENARVGYDGESYTSLKERLDAENSETNNSIDSLAVIINKSFDPESEELECSRIADKCIDTDGSIIDTASSSSFGVSDYIDVSIYDMVTIQCTSGYSKGFYGFYDASENFISGEFAIDGAYERFSKNLIVPAEAKYLVVSMINNTVTYIGAINKYVCPNIDNIEENLDDISTRVSGSNLINPAELVEGHLDDTGALIPNTAVMDWVTTGYIPVGEEKKICSSCTSSGSRTIMGVYFIAEYDSQKQLIKYTQNGSSDGINILSNSTKFFRLSYHGANTNPMISYGYFAPYHSYEEFYRVAEGNLTDKLAVNMDTVSDSIINTFESVGNLSITAEKLIANYSQSVVNYNDESYTIATYPLTGQTELAVTASANYQNYFYIIVDEDNRTILTSEPNSGGSAVKSIEKEIVTIPPNGKYLIVANIITSATPKPYIYNVGKGIQADGLSDYALEQIDSSIGGFKGKKWVCVGDSLTDINNRTTMHYYDYIVQKTGITVVNMGYGGSGYKKLEGEEHAFYQRVASIPSDADVVTIFGSGNDLTLISSLGTPTDTGTSTICGCINTTIDNIISIIPAVSLGIVAPTPWINNQPTIDDSNSMARYTEALREICKIRSIPFLDLYHCSNLRPWTEEGRAACYSKDDGNGVHPDETGHKLIAPRFMNFLESLIL